MASNKLTADEVKALCALIEAEGARKERLFIRQKLLDHALYCENAFGHFEIVGGAGLKKILDLFCPVEGE